MSARQEAVEAVRHLAEQAAADRDLLRTVAQSITTRTDAYQLGGEGYSLLTVALPESAMKQLDQAAKS